MLKFVASGQVPADGYWGPGRTSCSLRDQEPSTQTQQKGQAPHCPGSFPQTPSKEILAGPESTARFNQEPASPGTFRAIRQVQGQAGKPSYRSGTGISAIHGQAKSRLRLNPTQALRQQSSKTGKMPKPKLKCASGPMGKKGCTERPQDYEGKLLAEFEGS